jgi:hypothetical protein
MKRLSFALLAACLSVFPVPVFAAGVSGFSIVNATGLNMTGLTIRRFGTDGWKPLTGPRSPGARASVQFSDPDCAFDIQATLEGAGTVVWKDVNLCEAKTVILNRNASGALWVDYE